MKTKSRIPIQPNEIFLNELIWAAKKKNPITSDGIMIYPPVNSKSNWRLRTTINGKSIERSGGKSYESVNAAFLEIRRLREYSIRGLLGLPEKGHYLLDETIQNYIQNRGPKGVWKQRTISNREDDFYHLKKLATSNSLQCADLNAKVMREFLNNATASIIRARTIEGVLRTFVFWGYSHGYFDKEQYEASKIVRWSPPNGSNYRPAPSRREQSKRYFGDESQEGGEVPSHEQVILLANQAQLRYPMGQALIMISANLGTRAAETLVYTASKKVADSGKGNFVDLENEVVRVQVQVNDDPYLNSKTTKNGKRRQVVIPQVKNIASGFDILKWLSWRSQIALKEQRAGLNPLALIFPNKDGDIYTPQQLDKQVIRPSTDALGWRMPPYIDAKGKKRSMRRFTLHSMRDRYGVTAAEEWKYSESELLQQGSWSDISTVRRFYLGFTDITQQSVQMKHKEILLRR